MKHSMLDEFQLLNNKMKCIKSQFQSSAPAFTSPSSQLAMVKALKRKYKIKTI